MLNQFHEDVAGTMPYTSIEKYKLYIYSGALYNTELTWLRTGRHVTTEEITEDFRLLICLS